ncbi:Small subunit (SSU) processome component [Mucor velutinosus]|uniref:Small subunit (SSU) processome component n=1 Tax=Mucor velutinosus TaxID=708070 RepID=A0AAN7D9N6_9FUNG|nr:Small subunit (SSU) processome component [Mucor velutinosus]
MKFTAIASGIILAASSVAAQLTAPMQNYNVSSPVSNGPYVVGQILPCTIQLFENVVSDIALSISLDSAAAGSNLTYPIAASVDVSKTTASAKQNGNITYYEHSVNYNIPTTVVPGAYKVVFLDSKTNTHLDVPINVLPAASASAIISAASTGAAAATSTSAGSIFKESGNGVAAMSPSKAIVSLACVAVLAYML